MTQANRAFLPRSFSAADSRGKRFTGRIVKMNSKSPTGGDLAVKESEAPGVDHGGSTLKILILPSDLNNFFLFFQGLGSSAYITSDCSAKI